MSQRFNFIELPLDGLILIGKKAIEDHRGFFTRFFCAEEVGEIGFSRPIAQINHTQTREKGIVRGMHFQQMPHAEQKIVSCIRGQIMDVVVDIRKDSPTFLQWHAELLNAENQTSLFIPEGFAHGFQTLTDDSELIYIHSEFYSSQSEGIINALDPTLGISWPLPVTRSSERDQNAPMLGPGFAGISLQ